MDKDRVRTKKDVTDDVWVTSKGKAMPCPGCGNEIGANYHWRSVVCPDCKIMLIDKESGDREYDGQNSLSEWS